MTVNLHTHTYRCGHATGTEEEYILRAIENRIKVMGFSDHRFYPFNEFWKIAGEVGCTEVYGFDTHDTLSAFDGASIPYADKLISDYGLTLVENPKIVDL